MSSFKDLTGQKFGKLTVIKRVENQYTSGGNLKVRYLCKCDCEDEKYIEVTSGNLKNGSTKSCGCMSKDICKKKYNTYDLSKEYGIGYTNNGEEFYFDLEDFNKIKDYCWYYGKRNYVVAHTSNKNNIYMHQLITGYCNADHINRKPYDNRKCNLRPSTPSENVSNGSLRRNNKTGIIGVFWYDRRNKYIAKIEKNYYQVTLGYFSDFREAVVTRLKAEKEFFGDYAPQKHLFKEYGI